MATMKEKLKDFLARLQKHLHIDTLYLARGGFWISAAFFLSSMLGLIQIVIFANFLPKEAYGTYKYILSLAGGLSFLTLTGMNTAVTQASATSGTSAILPYAVKIQIKWNFLFSAVAAGISVYYFLNNNFLLAWSLLVLGITFPLATALNTYGAFLVGKKDFRRSSIYGAISSAIQILSLSVAALLTDDIFILIFVYALSILLVNLFFYMKTLRLYRHQPLEFGQKKDLLSYGRHLSGMHILSGIAQYVDKIVIFHYLGAVELAVYGLALAVPERIRGYAKTLSGTIMPKLSEKSLKDIDKSFTKRVLQGMALGAMISGAYILFAPIFYQIFLPKYLEALIYSQFFSLTLIFVLPANYISSVFTAHKMLRPMYYSSLSASILKIALYIILGRLFGIWGVVISILIVYLVGTMYNYYLCKREFKRIDIDEVLV